VLRSTRHLPELDPNVTRRFNAFHAHARVRQPDVIHGPTQGFDGGRSRPEKYLAKIARFFEQNFCYILMPHRLSYYI
jgi:hypothetical protein